MLRYLNAWPPRPREARGAIQKEGDDHDASQRKHASNRSAPAGHGGGGGGGGVGSPPRRFPPSSQAGARGRLLPTAAVLAALAALLAALPAGAAPGCTPAGTGTFPTVTYSSDSASSIVCDELTGGLTLTVEEGVTIGTQASPVTTHGIYADGGDTWDPLLTSIDADDADDMDSPGANDITIVNSGTIYVTTRGITVGREGTGKTRVEHKGKIVGTGAAARGINVWRHDGAAGTPSKGIEIVSTGDIDLSAATGETYGIHAITQAVAAGRTIPISVDVTGGTIKAGGMGRGINVGQRANGDVRISLAAGGTIEAGDSGIVAIYWTETGTGDITVSNSGEVQAGDDGLFAQHGGTGDVTVEAAKSSVIKAKDVGIVALFNSDKKGTVTVVNSGRIEANTEAKTVDGGGIVAVHKGAGPLKVEHRAGGRIVVRGTFDFSGSFDAGIVASYQPQTRTDAAGDTRSVEIVSAGAIESTLHGIVAEAVNNNGVDKKVPVTVRVTGGTIAADHHGILARAKQHKAGNSYNNGLDDHAGGGKIMVTVAHGATVTAKKDGIQVDGALLEGDMRAQTVIVRGKVMGGDQADGGGDNQADDGTKYAGVHMVKGGTVVIGPMAHVSATSKVAIKANAAGDMTVILEKDADGLVGHIDGQILNTAMTTFKTRTGGMDTPLAVGGMLDRRGQTHGVYDKVHRLKLATITGGHEFQEQEQSMSRLFHDRARVYEALPSVLLDLNGQTAYHERMAAPRDGNGVWARFGIGDGARAPGASTTAKDFRGRALAWDVSQYGIEAGLDFIPGATKRLLLGVSLHARQGEATVEHGGTIDVSGFGGGGSATYRDEAGLYLDGRFLYTYFNDIDLTSRTRGAVQADLSGHGYAFGLEAGKRLELAGLDHVALTPRARFVWSSVNLEDFGDLAGLAGSGRVALETATSLKGRLGLLAETAVGGATLDDWAVDGGRLFGSLDVEHEFAVDRETKASGTTLASEVRATWGRVGVGGAFSWNEGLTTLSGEGFYATAGSDNTDFGGSLSLTFRF